MTRCHIMAHRGASAAEPENTLRAFERALELGADFLELDLRKTADGTIVVVHDGDLERLTGRPGNVAELTLKEVRSYPVGQGECIPTLTEVLERFGGRTCFNLELKYYGGERELADLLRRHGVLRDVIVSSFIHPAIYRFKLYAPTAQTAALLVARVMSPLSILYRSRADWLNQYYEVISPDLVRLLHKRGKRIAAWTVNTASDIDRMLEMGVDALITDHPQRARERVAAWVERPSTEPLPERAPERLSRRAMRGLIAGARLPVRGLVAGARLPIYTLRSLRRWRETR